MTNKLIYSAPKADVFSCEVEQGFAQSLSVKGAFYEDEESLDD